MVCWNCCLGLNSMVFTMNLTVWGWTHGASSFFSFKACRKCNFDGQGATSCVAASVSSMAAMSLHRYGIQDNLRMWKNAAVVQHLSQKWNVFLVRETAAESTFMTVVEHKRVLIGSVGTHMRSTWFCTEHIRVSSVFWGLRWNTYAF